MATILKEGKKNIVNITYYKYICKRCGCEFEFEKKECKQLKVDLGFYRGSTPFYDIICPHCKQHTMISSGDLDKFEKETREVELEWQEAKDEYFEKNLRQYVYR